MRHFTNPPALMSDQFSMASYDVNNEKEADLFQCVAHISDMSEYSVAAAIDDLMEELGDDSRMQVRMLRIAFASDAPKAHETLKNMASLANELDASIDDIVNHYHDNKLNDQQRGVIKQLDGGAPDDFLRAETHQALFKGMSDIQENLLAISSAQQQFNEAAEQLVTLLYTHEPDWHKQQRIQEEEILKQIKDAQLSE